MTKTAKIVSSIFAIMVIGTGGVNWLTTPEPPSYQELQILMGIYNDYIKKHGTISLTDVKDSKEVMLKMRDRVLADMPTKNVMIDGEVITPEQYKILVAGIAGKIEGKGLIEKIIK